MRPSIALAMGLVVSAIARPLEGPKSTPVMNIQSASPLGTPHVNGSNAIRLHPGKFFMPLNASSPASMATSVAISHRVNSTAMSSYAGGEYLNITANATAGVQRGQPVRRGNGLVHWLDSWKHNSTKHRVVVHVNQTNHHHRTHHHGSKLNTTWETAATNGSSMERLELKLLNVTAYAFTLLDKLLSKNHTEHHGSKLNLTEFEFHITHTQGLKNQTARHYHSRLNYSQPAFLHRGRPIKYNITGHSIVLRSANSTTLNSTAHNSGVPNV